MHLAHVVKGIRQTKAEVDKRCKIKQQASQAEDESMVEKTFSADAASTKGLPSAVPKYQKASMSCKRGAQDHGVHDT